MIYFFGNNAFRRAPLINLRRSILHSNMSNKFTRLSAFGFSVFPVGKGKKTPACRWAKYQSERATADELVAWDNADLNVGIVCGEISNLLVIDVDSEEAQAFVDQLNLPRTATVATGKGRHYYFQFPKCGMRNRVKLSGIPLDIRGEGGFVVGPGSLHPSGGMYRWEVSPDDCDVAILPEDILGILTELAKDKRPPIQQLPVLAQMTADLPNAKKTGLAVYFETIVSKGIEELRAAGEGERNNTLNAVAYSIARYASALGYGLDSFQGRLTNTAYEIGLSPSETLATITSAWDAGSTKPIEWISVAEQYVFLGQRDKFFHIANRTQLAATAFDRLFDHLNPTEKGRFSSFLVKRNLIAKISDLRFDPSKAGGIFECNGEQFYNSYACPNITAVDGDCSPFLAFLEHLVPDRQERDHLVRMMAWTVLHPGQKLKHALLLTSPVQGIGKSTLIEIWREQLGHGNTRKTTSDEMEGSFQEYLSDTVMVFVEELNFGQGLNTYNKLKDLITGESSVVNRKFVATSEQPNLANFVFLSNMDCPVLIEENDRRFFVIKSPAQQRSDAYWAEFRSWQAESSGIIRGWLERIDLSDFKPNAPPPYTAAKHQLIVSSKSPLAQELEAMIEARTWPFSRDIFTLEEVMASLPNHLRQPTRQAVSRALRSLGCEPIGQFRAQGFWQCFHGCQPRFIPDQQARPSLWICRNVESWRLAKQEEQLSEYQSERGSVETITQNRSIKLIGCES